MEDRGVDSKILAERRQYVEKLKTFIAEHQNKISSLLQDLSWTPEHFVKRQETVICPYNGGHVITASSHRKHMEVCQFTSQGCPKEEVHLQLLKGPVQPENSIFEPVKLDENLINKIVWAGHKGPRKMPMSHEDFMVNFSTSERLAMAEAIAEKLKPANDILNVEKDEFLTIDWQSVAKKGGLTKDKPKTKFEILSELRDMRRRRQTYRAKNVHITKKSYTEIIREVINNQISMLVPDRQDESQMSDSKAKEMPAASSYREHSERRDMIEDRDRDRQRDRERRRDRSEEDDRHSQRYHRRDEYCEERRRDRRERSSHKHRNRHRSRDRSHSKAGERVKIKTEVMDTEEYEQSKMDETDGVQTEDGRDQGSAGGDGTSERWTASDSRQEKEDDGEILDSELFDVKIESQSHVSSAGEGEGKMDDWTDRDHSRSRKHKRKHKHKHKHKRKHRREMDFIELSD